MSNDEQSPPTSGIKSSTSSRREIVSMPFIRRMRYHLDSCAGTNKSQFVLGGLGLLVETGRLDAIHVLYMVVGHTKFGPDLVARGIAGRYNTQDTFNQAMLNEHISHYATAIAYDGKLLQIWRRATPRLFGPIEGIMSYRSMIVLGDDGKVNLRSVEQPESAEPYGPRGSYFLLRGVISESEKVAERSLLNDVIPNILKNKYKGVGEGYDQILGDQKGKRLLPSQVMKVNKARLFVQRTESDDKCFEISKWMTNQSVDTVNKVLKIITGYTSIGEMEKTPYGAKKSQIKEQFAKYVDPKYVPDKYGVTEPGTGRPKAVVQTTLTGSLVTNAVCKSGNKNNDGAEEVITSTEKRKPRWKEREHGQILVGILKDHFSGKNPRSGREAKRLADLMPYDTEKELPWDVRTLKRHATGLEREGNLR